MSTEPHRPPKGFAFKKAPIEGVQLRKIRKFVDERGWLAELWRDDEASEKIMPAMCYASITHPGITRGPHEHVDQTDWFCFLGPSNFLVCLWDNRPSSPTYGHHMRFVVGQDDPTVVIVPEGVVHGYRNIGSVDGLVTNLPNRLYAGKDRKEPVDEIRHEDEETSPFVMGS
jgi:dTDP-4-dehydrorhamnose 3,5-epimerase